MRSWFAAVAVMASSLFGAVAAQAAAPPNDNYAAAIPLAVGQEINGSDVDATAEPGEKAPNLSFVASSVCNKIEEGPECASSVWYLFQPAQSGEYTIETCDLGSDSGTGIAAYTGATIGSAVLVGYTDITIENCPSGVISSRLQLNATGGTAYHIQVSGTAGDQGSFYLRDYPGPPAARPLPDTGSDRRSSLLSAEGVAAGVVSGPRHSPSFALFSSPAGTSFECSLDGSAFGACGPLISYEGLGSGTSHVFEARATLGGAVDPSPLVETFTLDSTPPDTTIVSGPSGPIASQEPTWRTSSTERPPGGGVIPCGLDSMPLGFCKASTTFKALCQGPHDFRADASDQAGNTDPTPATAHVDVTVGPPCAAPTVEPSGFESIGSTTAYFGIKADTKGAGGSLHLEYGPTASYGTTEKDLSLKPGASSELVIADFLDPNTTYHYRVTVTTPFGSASTGDLTFTTKTPEHALQRIQNGATTALPYAATVEPIVDPEGEDSMAFLYLSAGAAVTHTSPLLSPQNGGFLSRLDGPQTVTFNITDLEPATTYHYRAAATQDEGKYGVIGPEGTFTTPPLKSPGPPGKGHFRLRKGQVKIGKLTRGSKKVTVKVSGLPARTLVKVGLKARKGHAGGKKGANANGRVTLKIKFSKKFRHALHDRRLKAVHFKVTAIPPGDTPSSVALKRRLHG